MKGLVPKLLIVLIIIAVAVSFFALDLRQYLTLTYLKGQQQAFHDYYQDHRVLTISIYAAIYILVTALSLPGAAVMTLAGAALLGFGVGLIVVSFASTIGATLAFLVSRWFPAACRSG